MRKLVKTVKFYSDGTYEEVEHKLPHHYYNFCFKCGNHKVAGLYCTCNPWHPAVSVRPTTGSVSDYD